MSRSEIAGENVTLSSSAVVIGNRDFIVYPFGNSYGLTIKVVVDEKLHVPKIAMDPAQDDQGAILTFQTRFENGRHITNSEPMVFAEDPEIKKAYAASVAVLTIGVYPQSYTLLISYTIVERDL